MILFISCGKGTSGTLDNMNNGGHVDPQPTNSGEVLTTAVSSVTSGHATIEGELTKLPGTQASVQIGFVWDTKSHTNIADYPNTYFTLDKRYFGKFKFIRAGLVGGTTAASYLLPAKPSVQGMPIPIPLFLNTAQPKQLPMQH